LIPGLEAIYKKRALTEHGKEWLVASYEPKVWGVINPTDIRWMETRLSSMPWHTHDQPLRIISIQAQRIPKTYISCTEFKDFHFMAQRAKSQGWDYHELKTGHDAMITVPNEVAQLLPMIVVIIGNNDDLKSAMTWNTINAILSIYLSFVPIWLN
jgi:hypothetical protein